MMLIRKCSSREWRKWNSRHTLLLTYQNMQTLPKGIARSILENLDSYMERARNLHKDLDEARKEAISLIKNEYKSRNL